MAQIQSPETYADGQQVTAARLNNQTNGAVLLPGAVTDQTAISGGVASGDAVIVHDASTSALRKATVGEVLGGGVPVVASSVTGVAGADLVITPAAGQKADVAGPLEADSVNSIGALTAGGNATVGGTLAVTGEATLTGGINGNLLVTGLVSASTVPTDGGHLTNKTYVDGTSSKTANGWCVLPNGLIMQWGTHLTAMANYSVSTVTFPIPFPNACFTVQLTARAVTATVAGATLENGIKLNGVPTTTTFGVYVNWAGNQAGVPIYPTWIAIGY
jgi:hypothetical protein